MNQTLHTPGPWWIRGELPGEPRVEFPVIKAWIDGSKSVTVCRVGSNNAYRSNNQHRDWHNARLISAAPALKAVTENFEIKGPDDDGLVWLVLHGNGTTGKAMFNLGAAGALPAQVALHLEADRRAAIAQATGSKP